MLQPTRVATVERLRATRDVTAVLSTGRRRAGRLLVVHATARGDDLAPRAAVVASRRVGTAVQRNRAKRLLREAVRHVALRPGVDLALVARSTAVSASMQVVRDELVELIQHLDLLEPEDGARAS